MRRPHAEVLRQEDRHSCSAHSLADYGANCEDGFARQCAFTIRVCTDAHYERVWRRAAPFRSGGWTALHLLTQRTLINVSENCSIDRGTSDDRRGVPAAVSERSARCPERIA